MTTVAVKRRAVAHDERNGDSPVDQREEKDEQEEKMEQKPRRKRAYRKALHAIRKEETEQLLQELTALQSQVEVLKTRVLSASSAASSGDSDTSLSAARRRSYDASTAEKALANQVLRRALRSRQREFARVQAQLTEYALFDVRAGSPIERVIRLPCDEHKRMTILTELRPAMLRDGAAFLHERLPRAHRNRAMHEDFGCEAANGDYLFTSLATLLLEGTPAGSRRPSLSVRAVFDALLGYFSALEITISETVGHTTIREDDDRSDEANAGILHNRLVSILPDGVRMESNTLFFSSFDDEHGGDEAGGQDRHGYGLIVCNYIDDDARYPYQPNHRVRRDLSSVIEIARYPRSPRSKDNVKGSTSAPDRQRQPTPSRRRADSPHDIEDVIVVTRWVFNRLHVPTFLLPSDRRRELQETSEQWVHALSTMLRNLQY